MKPTNQQKLILDYDGNSVVIAAPGSGKTFVLSQKIKQNLKLLLDHQGIIAISYTNKASNELKSRSLSNGEKPKSSFFGTIDKFNLSEIIIPFAKHLFGIPANEFKIIKNSSLSNEEKEHFEWLDRKITLEELDEEIINIIKEYFLKGLILIETIGVFADYVFTNSIACQKYIKSKYKFIYIDEYQDSGYQQHQIFLKILNLNITATAVGDLNQSIYAFSGKDSKFLLELTENDSFKYFKLDKNHRCHPSIINYSNYLLNPKTELIPVDNNQILFIRTDGNEISIANWIDKYIETIQNTFNVKKLNQIAILTRGNRTGQIIDENLNSKHRLFVSNALDINLNIWSAIFSNLLYFVFDRGHKFIDVIEVFSSYEKFSSKELKKLKLYKQNLESIAIQEPINKEALKTEFIKIAKVISPNTSSQESIELLQSVLSNEIELNSYQSAEEDEINIMTLHKSKGLEFDVVIHLDLYEWILPKKKPGPNNDFNNPIYDNWTQDVNLHYVGITRAKNGCILISSTKRTNYEYKQKQGKDSEFIWDNNIKELRHK
ncbi:DNA helicase-2/ATP-dependent DNA helicase PcrA [Mesonia algae]|uniref:DNA 3'-5' helicase n=1 Tax=Mesonia algae TaxID=213248 RepID=A0A2W7HW89_9FLAO|nr:ATP-dependent helicase [Mesonia algae]PZW37625.1 DNA helicase-2/ATP-dependent DNA helicase PcrA [Mesonia algae]